MAAAYLTTAQARTRLADFGLVPPDGEPYLGDLRAASDELDAMAPFVGWRTDPKQEREWPRKFGGDLLEDAPSIFNPDIVPSAILDWVALRAHVSSDEEGEEAISSESVLDRSVSYARPKKSRAERLLPNLDPYLLHTGSRG